MAATDQTYRNQKALDIVFAVSCVLMLVSIVGMFIQDYNREFKQEQREFRDVEQAIAERGALSLLPDEEKVRSITERVESEKTSVEANKGKLDEAEQTIKEWRPKKVRRE